MPRGRGIKSENEILWSMVDRLKSGYETGIFSPFGSADKKYGDHVFWDADVWVFPALALTAPEVAGKIPALRYAHRDAAAENFELWRDSGYPIYGGGRHVPRAELVKLAGGARPLMYPWESKDGREASPNPDTKFQHHVTGGVALMMHRAIQLGLIHREQGEEVILGCAAFYLYRMEKNADGRYGLRGVVSPSESHSGDNDLYTNAIADWTIRRALGEKVWPRGRVRFVRRGDAFATFDGDDYETYQQAAALLAVYPVEHPDIVPKAAEMYEMYNGKYTENGPAMAHAIDCVVASKLGRAAESYADWRSSWVSYSTDVSQEFREKPVTGESYFLTGAAGAVQAGIAGLWGVRIVDEAPPGQAGVFALKHGGYVLVSPMVPEHWDSEELNLIVAGEPLKVVVRSKEFEVRYGDQSHVLAR